MSSNLTTPIIKKCKCGSPATSGKMCKECRKSYNKRYYKDNRSYFIKKARVRKVEVAEELKTLVEQMKDKPCQDCGKSYPTWVMDFDHLDPTTKVANVADLVRRQFSKEKILNEMAKCEVVCANCHRQRTHDRN